MNYSILDKNNEIVAELKNEEMVIPTIVTLHEKMGGAYRVQFWENGNFREMNSVEFKKYLNSKSITEKLKQFFSGCKYYTIESQKSCIYEFNFVGAIQEVNESSIQFTVSSVINGSGIFSLQYTNYDVDVNSARIEFLGKLSKNLLFTIHKKK